MKCKRCNASTDGVSVASLRGKLKIIDHLGMEVYDVVVERWLCWGCARATVEATQGCDTPMDQGCEP